MIRLYRILPLIIVLAVLALVLYLIMSFRYSSNKAKSLMIKAFIWIFGILSIAFAIITLFAVLDKNLAVTELFGSCLAVTLIGLGVTFICRAIFRKNHPLFGEKVTEATFVNESITSKFGKAFSKALSQALKDVFGPNGKK